ncbi:MAG: thioredoxin family protein [Candidatus Hodarchaeales archaeon]|jgi:thioredoxin 1
MVTIIDEKEFIQRVKANQETNNSRLDAFTDWCPPCKVSAPIYEKLSQKYTAADFVKINVDNNPRVAEQLRVQGVPTFVILRGNKVIAKIVGADMRKVEKEIKKAVEDN